jgi:hypothetical protein
MRGNTADYSARILPLLPNAHHEKRYHSRNTQQRGQP